MEPDDLTPVAFPHRTYPLLNVTSRIVPLVELPSDIEKLRNEAIDEGFRFVTKLIAEWRSGWNGFAQPGEVLLGVFQGVDLVAVGGLNRDPYADQDGVGRLRHLYVRRSTRHSGVGTILVRQLLERAGGAFHLVRLRTETRQAADFYVGLGFRPVEDETATHVRSVRQA